MLAVTSPERDDVARGLNVRKQMEVKYWKLHTHARWSMQEAILCTTGKLGNAGRPVQESRSTWKPVCAGDLVVCRREARQSGRPCDQYTVRYMEAGPCRWPCGVQLGSPAKRDAQSHIDSNIHGCWDMEESPVDREATR